MPWVTVNGVPVEVVAETVLRRSGDVLVIRPGKPWDRRGRHAAKALARSRRNQPPRRRSC